MSNTVLQKRSGASGNTPTSLQYGEIAINYADGKMFYRDSSDVIRTMGYNWTVASANKLSTPRTINGVPFDGTQNITISSSTVDPTDSVVMAMIMG